MGLLDKLSDQAVSGLIEAETVRIHFEEMAALVEREFIVGSDTAVLEKVLKTAKGGFILEKEMQSFNKRFLFHVGARPHGLIWLNSKPVWVFDRDENRFYQLDRDLKWKKFYSLIDSAIRTEKKNRGI